MYYTYITCMEYMYNVNTLKPVTLYLLKSLYEKYQLQAQKRGRKASELIREAMEEYAERNFNNKISFEQLNLDRTVSLKEGAGDFAKDDFKSDFLDDEAF